MIPRRFERPFRETFHHDKRRPNARHHRWVSSPDRCAEAQRSGHDLRPARHPHHRPHAHGAGRGHAGHLVPPRAARRQRRRRRRLPDRQARHLPHGVGARLPERPDGAGQRDDQLLPHDPDQRLQRARDRRPAAGRLRGDGPARDRQAPLQGGLSRAPRRGHRRRHRARHPFGRLGPSGRRLPGPAGQAFRADHGRRGGPQIPHQGGRSGAAADPLARRGAARPGPAQGREDARSSCWARAPRMHGRCRHPGLGREDRHSVPADVHGQGAAARQPSAVGIRRAFATCWPKPTWSCWSARA